jgi:hypothetical protein
VRSKFLTFLLAGAAAPVLAQTPPPGPPATAKDPQQNEMVRREAVPTIDMGAAQKRTPGRKEPTPAVRAVGGVSAPDGSSVDTIVDAMYQSVSHGPEEEPNWKRMHEIFLPVGVLIPPRRPDAQEFAVLDVDAFQDRVRKGMAAAKERGDSTAFFESEIARKTDCFGNVCHVFSTYEGRHAPGDEKPFVRGINSVQLVNDGKRWWITSVVWDSEKPDKPIPTEYEKK